ncbi:hypothetical protein AUJ46_06470 [Candidatus Peregrinibacteria bacterium CG1_02_54_53]|nr:MAG: hypothetical protein AUJ46_06470 [Candidatus Peregrinibacteria bacterium CG1_02_54_53]
MLELDELDELAMHPASLHVVFAKKYAPPGAPMQVSSLTLLPRHIRLTALQHAPNGLLLELELLVPQTAQLLTSYPPDVVQSARGKIPHSNKNPSIGWQQRMSSAVDDDDDEEEL